jgi:hypothetical protein
VKGRSGNPCGKRSHGMTKSGTFKVWAGIKHRCLNPNDPNFARYGGRGITVCSPWRESFEAFRADMGDPPAGGTIERIDNERGYEPGNCRWATVKEQNRNRRDTRWVTLDGETASLAEWCERRALKYKTVHMRINGYGWSPARALALGAGHGG